MATVGQTQYYKRGDDYVINEATGNDTGLTSGGYSNLGDKQGYINSLQGDLTKYQGLTSQLMPNGKSSTGANFYSYSNGSNYQGVDPFQQVSALQQRLAEAQAGQGLFADNYNSGAQIVNGNYTTKAAIDQGNALQAGVANGTQKVVGTENGVNIYAPTGSEATKQPFIPTGTMGTAQNSGQSNGLSTALPPVNGQLASINTGTTDASGYQTSPTATKTQTSTPNTALQPGSTDSTSVKALQDYLVKNGYMTQAQVDTGYGTYGPQTTDAVKALQEKLGVDNSTGVGYFGPRTITALSGQTQPGSSSVGSQMNAVPTNTSQTSNVDNINHTYSQGGQNYALNPSTGRYELASNIPQNSTNPTTNNSTTGTTAQTTSNTDALAAQYAALIGKSPEEIAAQQAINNSTNASTQGQFNVSQQPIAQSFISGQQAAMQNQENIAKVPLQQQLANAQAKRQTSLDAVKFQLDRADLKDKNAIAQAQQNFTNANVTADNKRADATLAETIRKDNITENKPTGTLAERQSSVLSQFDNAFVPGAKMKDGTAIVDQNGFITPVAWKSAISDAVKNGISRSAFIKEFGNRIFTDKASSYGLTPVEIKLING